MTYVYIAGPYTAPDPVVNTRNAILAGDAVRSARNDVAPFVPHLNLLWHLVTPHEPGYWYSLDIEWLKKCDALIRLPGASPGGDAEVAEAVKFGIPVYYSVESFLNAQARRA